MICDKYIENDHVTLEQHKDWFIVKINKDEFYKSTNLLFATTVFLDI